MRTQGFQNIKHRYFIFLFFLLFNISGLAQTTDTIYTDDYYIIEKRNKKGISNGAYVKYNNEGDLLEKGNYKNGKRNGRWQYYYYFDTPRDSTNIIYYVNTIRFTTKYKNGLMEGECYHELLDRNNRTKNFLSFGNYTKGKPNGEWTLHRLEDNAKYGEQIAWCYFEEGKKKGPWKMSNYQAEKEFLLPYKTFLDSVEIKMVFADNSYAIGQYEDGERSGVWHYYTPGDVLYKSFNFNMNKYERDQSPPANIVFNFINPKKISLFCVNNNEDFFIASSNYKGELKYWLFTKGKKLIKFGFLKLEKQYCKAAFISESRVVLDDCFDDNLAVEINCQNSQVKKYKPSERFEYHEYTQNDLRKLGINSLEDLQQDWLVFSEIEQFDYLMHLQTNDNLTFSRLIDLRKGIMKDVRIPFSEVVNSHFSRDKYDSISSTSIRNKNFWTTNNFFYKKDKQKMFYDDIHELEPMVFVFPGYKLSEKKKFFYADQNKTSFIDKRDGRYQIYFWNSNKESKVKRLVMFSMLNQGGYVFFSKDNYYLTSHNMYGELYFEKDLKLYPFEQFDLKYNRPDIILDRLGYAEPSLIAAYHQAYLKRLKKMNFTEDMLKDDFHIPEIKIENFEEMPIITDSTSVELSLKLNDSKYKLDRLNVWVNDVAIYGTDGISVRDKNSNNYTTTIPVELNRGKNKIQVSVLNQAGAESFKETVNIESTAGKVKPDLYINVISVSEYQQSEMNLRYAVKDGRDIANLFANIDRSHWGNIYVDTIFNTNATIENVAKLKEKLLKTDINDEVILYVSGHGLLSNNLDFYFASHDVDFAKPEDRGISYELLESLLDGIPARKKLFMMDACHSGEVDKDELEEVRDTVMLLADGTKSGLKTYSYRGANVQVSGGNKQNKLGLENSFELMQELFTNLNRGSGAVVISAAGGDSYALESDRWNNGVFTYSVLNGLKNKEADTNNDGEITVSELRKYVINQVQELTNGRQKPTSRQENVEFDFRVW